MIESDGVGRRRRQAANSIVDVGRRRRCRKSLRSLTSPVSLILRTSLFPLIAVTIVND